MAMKSITQRWAVNSLSIIGIAIIIASIAFSFIMQNYYYSGVEQVILGKASVVRNVLSSSRDETNVNFTAEVRNIVQNSDDKNKFEITAINHDGDVVLSSSGFPYTKQEVMYDYINAKNSAEGIGYYVGEKDDNEKIMAVTAIIPAVNSEYAAIRYVVSMTSVDRAIAMSILAFFGAAMVVFCFIMVSGLYFVRSIVIPVREIGAVARKFAAGDMSLRIEKKSNDEVGELAEIINYMADELNAAEDMKNEFISSVSHELRTPLTAIKGWSETLMTMDDADAELLKKGMRVITSETERLSGMVEELLDFSRIQSGRLTMQKESIDILAELGEAVMIYAERAKRDGIEFIYDEPDMVPFVYGDKNRLRQVFINVIDNAIKYSDPGDIVTISVEKKDGFVDVTVADEGCGISEVDMPRIKTKFFKANMTRRGSGIGLAVADEIMAMHNGEILIESELNVGTSVTIRLPEGGRRIESEMLTRLQNEHQLGISSNNEN